MPLGGPGRSRALPGGRTGAHCIHGAKIFGRPDVARGHRWRLWRAPRNCLGAVRQAARDVGAERMLHVGLLLSESLLGVRCPQKWLQASNTDGAARNVRQGRGLVADRGLRATSVVTKSNVPAENGRRRAGRDLLPDTIVAFSDRGRLGRGEGRARVRVCGRRSRGRFG